MMESIATIKRPTIGRDSRQGVTQTPWKVSATNLPCSVQEAGASVQTLYSQRNTIVNITVYFSQDPLCDVNDIIVATNQRTGNITTLLVQGQSTSDTHGRLWSVDCQLVRQPV